MRSVSSAKFITPPLTRKKSETLKMLLDGFASSTNFCIQKCLEGHITSRASLHHAAYDDWKAKHDLASHWFHSTGQVATQTLRSWRTRCRQGQADQNRPPVYTARTMRLERWDRENGSGICRFHGNAIQIRIRESEHLWLPLIVTDHHERMYLQAWREEKARSARSRSSCAETERKSSSLSRDRSNQSQPRGSAASTSTNAP